MKMGGVIYTVTDVKDLHEWMTQHLSEHPLFQRLSQHEMDEDLVTEKLFDSSEEGKKVTRNKGDKYMSFFRRIEDPKLSTTVT